jgi:hypothetical protein
LLRRARVTCARGSSRVTCDAVKRPRANRQMSFSPTRAGFHAPGGSQQGVSLSCAARSRDARARALAHSGGLGANHRRAGHVRARALFLFANVPRLLCCPRTHPPRAGHAEELLLLALDRLRRAIFEQMVCWVALGGSAGTVEEREGREEGRRGGEGEEDMGIGKNYLSK